MSSKNKKSEFALINWLRRQTTTDSPHIEKSIGDDMAILTCPGDKTLITTDMLLDGVHFNRQTATLQQIGYKAMAASLSDCAAMASLPLAAVVAVALPKDMTMTDAQLLHAGLQQAAETYACPLVGGDTTSWDQPLAIDVTMLSRAAGVSPVLRSGAQVDDAIFVTGSLGGSLAGRHLEFTPRVQEARQLAQLTDLHALIDISDGLAPDLAHICRESNVAAVLEPDRIPISPAAQQAADPLAAALGDGEDFELCFTVAPDQTEQLQYQWPNHSDTPITRIGRIITVEGKPTVYLQRDNRREPVTVKGWEHFRD